MAYCQEQMATFYMRLWLAQKINYSNKIFSAYKMHIFAKTKWKEETEQGACFENVSRIQDLKKNFIKNNVNLYGT